MYLQKGESPVQPIMLRIWKETVHKLKEDTCTLYLASRDPQVPFAAKVVLVVTVAYALSPIDLIPDFIPILGYLDDLLLLPLGIWLSIKIIPPHVLNRYRQQAKTKTQIMVNKTNYIMAAVTVTVWLLIGYWAYRDYIDQIG